MFIKFCWTVLFFSPIIFGLNSSMMSDLSNPQPAKASELIQASDIVITSVKLIAREEKLPPLGIPQNPNRNIGFASVLVRLENHQTKNNTLTLKKIEIREVKTGKIQPFNWKSQTIELKPLENSELLFQSANKTGYSLPEKMKAIITYQINGQTRVIESEPVEIQS